MKDFDSAKYLEKVRKDWPNPQGGKVDCPVSEAYCVLGATCRQLYTDRLVTVECSMTPSEYSAANVLTNLYQRKTGKVLRSTQVDILENILCTVTILNDGWEMQKAWEKTQEAFDYLDQQEKEK